jgi:hypothetical protein
MRTIQYKGSKIPLFNTPISENDLIKYNLNYDRFAIHDLKSGKIRLVSNSKPFVFDIRKIDIGSSIKYCLITFGVFRLLSFKKAISKKIKPIKISVTDIKKSKVNFEKELAKYRQNSKPVKNPIKKTTAKA